MCTLAKILAGGLPGGAVAGRRDILSMIEFRNNAAWNSERRVQHPGTFNANPLSAAAGSTMLRIVATGEPHRHADRLNEELVRQLNEVLDLRGVPGSIYGLASYFHITLGKDALRPADGIEWPDGAGPPPRMSTRITMALRRAMLNEGVDLMGGAGGFVSAVHAEEDIAHTVSAFSAAIDSLQAEGTLEA
jgi:glutamate-1-semialdehyde 2,1-aminomutase